jgi:hypothetical protein
LLALVLVNSASWFACIKLAIWLAVKPGAARHLLVTIVPSLSVIVLIYNVYLLGQPNLALLALLLAAFACVRLGRPIGAGAFVGTAAAIKAFPILVLGYLIYRRMWVASVATVAVLAAWLFVAPLPFRTTAQVLDDVLVWSQGMLLTYNSHGIAQRPVRSYSYKNQSIMALAHRLLREVPADGESVLARKSLDEQAAARPSTGPLAIDPPTDLLSFLKPHLQGAHPTNRPAVYRDVAAGPSAPIDTTVAPIRIGSVSPSGTAIASNRHGRWEDVLLGSDDALRNAWRVNMVSLSFRVVTVITGLSILGLTVYVVIVLPPLNRRTFQTDALEFALVTLLTVMFSPLSFNYAYVWLLYPTTLALHLVISEPTIAPHHRLKVAWILAILLIPASAIPMPQTSQAYGNLFVPSLLLVFGLGAMLHASGRGCARPDGAASRRFGRTAGDVTAVTARSL